MNDMTNPKDLLGLKKVQLGLLPAAGAILGALAMGNGAKKYGPYNWRAKRVRMSIYLDAIERHIMALRDGEDLAADSGVHHIGHVIACGAILADAIHGGFLVDDRPPPGPAAKIIAETEIRASGTETQSTESAVYDVQTHAKLHELRELFGIQGPSLTESVKAVAKRPVKRRGA